jgi:hypothetical protein
VRWLSAVDGISFACVLVGPSDVIDRCGPSHARDNHCYQSANNKEKRSNSTHNTTNESNVDRGRSCDH